MTPVSNTMAPVSWFHRIAEEVGVGHVKIVLRAVRHVPAPAHGFDYQVSDLRHVRVFAHGDNQEKYPRMSGKLL